MRATRRLAIVVAAVAWAPVAAIAQTTSSSTSTTTSSTPSTTASTTSTTASTTTTTVVVVDDACVFSGGCSQNEPDAALAAASGTQAGVYGGACWRIVPASQFPGPIRCASVALPDPFPRTALLVRPGEVLTLQFNPEIVPQGVRIGVGDSVGNSSASAATASSSTSRSFTADFSEGTYFLTAQVTFSQGVVPYFFLIRVQAATQATPAPIAFTG